MYKILWQTRVKEVKEFHIKNVKLDSHWSIEKTALALNRSVGSICEDLMLADWMRSYPKIESYKRITDALIFIRNKKKELRIR